MVWSGSGGEYLIFFFEALNIIDRDVESHQNAGSGPACAPTEQLAWNSVVQEQGSEPMIFRPCKWPGLDPVADRWGGPENISGPIAIAFDFFSDPIRYGFKKISDRSESGLKKNWAGLS
jgi:hypothetical protein